MFTTRKNATVKALQSAMSAKATRGNAHARIEHNLSSYTAKDDPSRPGRHNYSHEEFQAMFSRRYGGHCGATKRTHVEHPDGWEFEFIVVKRYKYHGHEFWGEGCGNQLIDEIDCWNRLAETADADFLCPILKYFTCKSDKVKPLADKMKERVVIIAQKAVHVDDLEGACRYAEKLNRQNGYHGISASRREQQLEDMAKRMGWRDVRYNPGNSGVIFDYAQGCYKAVFIDYAL
jgi:hypothetical protein